MMKRIMVLLLSPALFLCWGGSALAEDPVNAVDTDAALERAAALEAEQGKLRSVVVHMHDGETSAMPTVADSPESAWTKAMAAALEARWDLAESEAGDILTETAQKAYGEAARTELEALEPYGEVFLDDPLLELFQQAYLETLRREIAAAESGLDPIAFAWEWTEARQDGIKILYFLNRYYGVSVRKTYRDQMNSTLYEGALIVSEETVQEIAQKWEASVEEDAEEAEGAIPAAEQYGPEIWHTDPTGAYDLRIHDFDPASLSIMIDLRATDNPNRASQGRIDLSQWQKYTEGRFSVGTFYQADDISVQEEKISFTLHMNVLVDGRLHREVRGKISLKLPTEKSSGSETKTAAAKEEEANPFDEPLIEQDFYDLQVGDIIKMGYYEQDGDASNLREPIEWKVISLNKKKAVALVVSVYALENRPYGVAGDGTEYERDGFNWKTSDLRTWLNGDFYNQCFTGKEKERIREASNVTKDPSGRFTTKDHVFLLSAVEAPRYLKTPKGLTCMPTPAVLQKLGTESAAIIKDGSCKWWLRELVKAVKLDRKGNNPRKTYNAAGYVSGSDGMLDYRKKIGLTTYEEDQALVRPAMWIKYDGKEKNK